MDDKILQKYIEGNASDTETKEVMLWIDADDENKRHFMSLRKLYDINIWNCPKEKNSPKKSNNVRKLCVELLKVAGIFIIAFLLSKKLFYGNQATDDTVVQQIVRVPTGQRAEVLLADGSSVWLNAGSELIFPNKFTGDMRTVCLTGEGFFNVKTNKEKPFIVEANGRKIKATGTQFNVIAYNNSDLFETSLIDGLVDVYDKSLEKPIHLIPNQCVQRKDDKFTISKISNRDYFLWRDGIISFDNEPIMSIIQKLELYFDVKITVNNKEVLANKYRYSGKIRMRDGLDHALTTLQTAKPFKYKKDDEKNTLEIN